MKIHVDYRIGDRFSIGIRHHTITVDQPVDNGGTDRAPTPTELFVASLASCVAFYVRRWLARHGLDAEGLRVTADYTMATDRPARVGAVDLHVDLPPHDLEPAALAALHAVASHCTVHNSLARPPEVTIHLT